MSLDSSNSKLSSDVDPTIRRAFAAFTRDLEQIFLLLGQGEGGFSNQSPGSISQDVTTDGMGVEGNQGDYRFSGPVSQAELAASSGSSIDTSVFLQKSNNLSDVVSASTSRTNLGLGTIATQASSAVSITGGTITGITDLAIADGGTGASTAATARTNLGSTTVGDAVFIAASAAAARTALNLGAIALEASPLAVLSGGTGATGATAAMANLYGIHLNGTLKASTSYTTAGTFTHTWNAATKFVYAIIVGGGGGGAGGSTASGVASAIRAGGGGGSGSVAYIMAVFSGSTSSVVVGAAGALGATTADGGTGGDSSCAAFSTSGFGGEGGTYTRGDGGTDQTGPRLRVFSSYISMEVRGAPGQPGRVDSITTNGAGAVTAIGCIGGRGGWANPGGSPPAGAGGTGGNDGAAGTVGIAGSVTIYEYG